MFNSFRPFVAFESFNAVMEAMTGVDPGTETFYLLLESGDKLLLESGDNFLLEAA